MTSSQIKFSEIIAPGFYNIHQYIRDEIYSEIWLKGGRGSTKSTFAALQIIFSIIRDSNANAIAFRKTGNTIRDSILPTILSGITKLERDHKFDHIKSPTEITYKPTNQKILMRGLDDESKIRSIKAEKGYFKILWFEELQEFSGMEEIRSVRQSVTRGGDKFITIFTFNPPKDPNHWIYKELSYNNPDRIVHHSHYKDVPRHWLGEEFFKIAEQLRINNYEAYQHEYDGVPVENPDEIVFSGKYEVKEFETPAVSELYQQRFFFGADWGFSVDPTTLVRCFIKDGCLWIDYESYIINNELADIATLFDKVPESRLWKIYGDSSRPDIISLLKNSRNNEGKYFNIHSVRKTTVIQNPLEKHKEVGYIRAGIDYIRNFKKVIIHPRCKNTIDEFRKYRYKVDKHSKDVLPIIIDKNNHCIDALRYALADYIRYKVSFLDLVHNANQL